MSLKRKDSSQPGGLRVAADDPHLVSLGGGRLSTAVTIHHLPVGHTSIGSSIDCSVVLCGSGVQPQHCTLYRAESGEVILVAERDSRVLVDGKKITEDTNLSQGAMLTIGKSNYLRFNNPAEAEMLRSTIGSKERISMPSIDFNQDSTSSGGSSTEGSPADEMMKPDLLYSATKRNSAHNVTTLDKVTKNEFSGNMNNFHHSPKVFSADSITVNTPAKDVLGAKFNNFTKNLTQMFGKNTDNNQKSNTHKTNNNLNESKSPPPSLPSVDAGPQTTGTGFGLAKVNNVSAAPPATPSQNSPKVQQFSACYDRYPKPGSYGALQVFPMNTCNTEMNTADRESAQPIHHPAEAPSPLMIDLHKEPGLTELQRQRAQIERMQEQEISKKEHERLDEILKMCADFERDNQTPTPSSATVQSSPIVQNRIKTNGSLPREKKNFGASEIATDPSKQLFSSSPPTTTDLGYQPTKPSSGYENVHISAGARKIDLPSSVKDSPRLTPPNGYENVTMITKKSGYVPQSPRTRIKTCVSPKKDPPCTKKSEYDMLVQSFEDKLRLEIQLLRDTKQTNQHKGSPFAQQQPPHIDNAANNAEPVYGTLENRNKNVNQLTLILKKDVDVKRCEQLKNERKQVLAKVREMKTRIADLQRQDDEVMREMDMEKALVTAELAAEQAHLMGLQRNIATLQSKIHRMETQRTANRTMQETQQNKMKQAIEMKQHQMNGLESLLEQNQHDGSIRDELNATADELENESKNYEDMEFQYLEEEAEWSAYHEELHHDLRTLTKLAVEKSKHIQGLESQGVNNQHTACTDSRVIEKDVWQLIADLEQWREHLKQLDQKIFQISGQPNTQSESDDDDDDTNAGPPTIPTRDRSNILEQMSQSLFGSQEILTSANKKPLDLMSRSVNENMFYQNNNIESRAPLSSTPKRLRSVDISDDITRISLAGHDQLRQAEQQQLRALTTVSPTTTTDEAGSPISSLKYNLSPPFQHKSPVPPVSPSISGTPDVEMRRAANLNLSIESDDFEVNPLERRVPSQDDIDRICKITLDAPISTQGASFKVIESIREIERNRQLLLAQQGSHVIEHERQKMNDLKKKSHDEARAQYMQSQSVSFSLDSDSYTTKDRSVENAPEGVALQSMNNNTASPQSPLSPPKRSSVSSPQRHSQPDFERARPLSDTNSELSYDALSDKPFKSTNDIRTSANRLHENGGNNNYAASPQYHQAQYQQQHQQQQHHNRNSQVSQSDSNSESGECGTNGRNSRSLVAGSKRNLPKHQRPLTRYLPIMSLDLDLRQHIESAGHQVTLCPHVLLDAFSCRGYLHKLGATFHGWSRRWFLFDRQKMALIYFSDKSERKPRGGAYFSTIDEVYLDHMNTSKSGRPYCTFIVKTKKRSYHLQAASDAAARIWIDAIITGAQGNIDY